MFKIGPKISAAVGATRDRLYVRNYSKQNIKNNDTYYEALVKKTGPSTNNLSKMWESWKLAYKDNLEYQKLVKRINDKFKGK